MRQWFITARQRARRDYMESVNREAIRKGVRNAYPGATEMRHMAVGQKERDALVAMGWKIESQDMSEHGRFITRWQMVKPMLVDIDD